MRKKIIILTVITSLLLGGTLVAQTHKLLRKKHAKKHKAKLTRVVPASFATNPVSDFKISGYIDGAYNYLRNSVLFTSGTNNRVYDIAHSEVTLQQAAITLAYQPKQGFGGLLNAIIGRDPWTFAPYGWNPSLGSDRLGIAIPQAFLQYATGNVTLMGGNFLELAGAEGLIPLNNTNFSRGILFGYAEPTSVLGLRSSFVPNDKLTLYAGLNNGWDSIRDTGRDKTLELGFLYNASKLFSLAAYGYTGQQRVADRTATGPTGQRTLIDIIGTFNPTEKLTFILNYDHGLQNRAALPTGEIAAAEWQGIAGYANYQLNPKWRTSLRGEYFYDQDGYRTGIKQHWSEATATIGYAPVKEFELRAEARHDFSDQNAFQRRSGDESRHQYSFALEAVYKHNS